jgi:outer membrane protein assembly factor BamB
MTRFLVALVGLFASGLVCADHWPEFRGPGGTSLAQADLPAEWSAEKNIAWSADIPGRGLSGPIIVDDLVILTASSGASGSRLHVFAIDVNNGKMTWHRQFWATGNLSCHPKMCMATPTPATDGKHVLAFYSSNDLACLDLEGNVLWYRGLTHDYPNASNSVGMSASPVVVDGTAIVSVENEGDSFLTGIDVATGKNLWKEPRPKSSQWASPIALRRWSGDKDLVLTQSTDGIFVREPRSGKIIWKLEARCSSIPSATVSGAEVFVPADGVTAAKLSLDQGPPAKLWQSNRLRAGTASLIVHEGRLYTVNSAILNCGDAKTGEPLWKVRLKGNFSSTPVIAGNKLYAFSEDGIAFVVELGDKEGKLISENKMGSSPEGDGGESILCSPAIAGNALYVRSDAHLWKIAKTP